MKTKLFILDFKKRQDQKIEWFSKRLVEFSNNMDYHSFYRIHFFIGRFAFNMSSKGDYLQAAGTLYASGRLHSG